MRSPLPRGLPVTPLKEESFARSSACQLETASELLLSVAAWGRTSQIESCRSQMMPARYTIHEAGQMLDQTTALA